MSDQVHLFVYGTLAGDGAAAGMLDGCERVGDAVVDGTLFDIDGEYPALMLAGADRVHGELWRCSAEHIHALDRYEAVERGLFRRVGVEVEGTGCWAYVAGPTLAKRLRPERRIRSGRWGGA